MIKSLRRHFEVNEPQQFISQQHCVLFLFISVLFLITISARAHEPALQTQELSEPQATSILDSTMPNGRIGGYRYHGSIKPTPGVNSRFSNDARYGNAGNIVGVDHNSTTSRFSGVNVPRNRSQIDFNVLALRNETQRSHLEQKKQAIPNAQSFDSGAPRMVRASIPQRFPYASERPPLYGKYLDSNIVFQDPSANTTFSAESSSTTGDLNVNSASPKLMWMRGRIPQNDFPSASVQNGGNDSFSGSPSAYTEVNNYGDYAAFASTSPLLGGSLNSPVETNNVAPRQSIPTPEQLQRAFQEYLEAQLLRSPDVNPLSPVLVSYQDGVATVCGVVPTPDARAAAGLILLSDPRVSKVNNLMTCANGDNPEYRMTLPAQKQNVSN